METVLTVIIGLLLLTAFVVIHEWGHFFVAKKCGIEMQEFSIGFGPKLLSRKGKDGMQYSLRAILFGGYVKFAGEDDDPENNALNRASLKDRCLTVVAGAAMNFVTAFVLAVIFLSVFGGSLPAIDKVMPGSSAEKCGVQSGDVITEMNGVSIDMFEDLTYAIDAGNGSEMTLTVLRGDSEEHFDIPYELQEDGSYKVGLNGFNAVKCSYSFIESVGLSFKWLGMLVKELFGALGAVFTTPTGITNLAGPVGTISIIGEAARMGAESMLRLASLISINLAVINLMPIPALDGGKLLMYAIEAIRKKPVSQKVEAGITVIGFLAIIGFAIILTVQDVARLAGG